MTTGYPAVLKNIQSFYPVNCRRPFLVARHQEACASRERKRTTGSNSDEHQFTARQLYDEYDDAKKIFIESVANLYAHSAQFLYQRTIYRHWLRGLLLY